MDEINKAAFYFYIVLPDLTTPRLLDNLITSPPLSPSPNGEISYTTWIILFGEGDLLLRGGEAPSPQATPC